MELAPLFHLTEQKGSRLCQTASQRGKRESASGAYVGSASTGRYRRGQALSSFPQLSQQSLESALTWQLRDARILVEDSRLRGAFDGFKLLLRVEISSK